MQLYDCHVHTDFSHDGKATCEAQCMSAIEKGLSGITITEHNYPAPKGYAHGENVLASCEKAKQMAEAFHGKLSVFCGVEIADITLDGCDNAPFYAIPNLDFVLGSVHTAALIRTYFPDCFITYCSKAKCSKMKQLL